MPTVAVLTGGFSEGELRDAGAVEVFDSIAGLGEKVELLADVAAK